MNREQLTERLRDVFASRGFDGATLAEIARATGLSKASLYHHFPDGKTSMGIAMLEDAGQRLDALVLAPLRSKQGPRARLGAMLDGLESYFERGQRPCMFAVFAAGPQRPAFAPLIRDHLQMWLELTATTFMDAGMGRKEARRRSRDLIARVEGGALMAQAMGDPKMFRQVVRRLRSEIEAVD